MNVHSMLSIELISLYVNRICQYIERKKTSKQKQWLKKAIVFGSASPDCHLFQLYTDIASLIA
jgi:hypothetical protein